MEINNAAYTRRLELIIGEMSRSYLEKFQTEEDKQSKTILEMRRYARHLEIEWDKGNQEQARLKEYISELETKFARLETSFHTMENYNAQLESNLEAAGAYNAHLLSELEQKEKYLHTLEQSYNELEAQYLATVANRDEAE